MSAIPMANVTPLAGGSFFSGCAFAITFQMLNDYGLSLNVLNDKSRQSILNLIALVGSTAGFIAYCYNQTKESITMINITAFILFASVQYGLVILNHNTIVRARTLWNYLGNFNVKTLNNYCLVLYFLPLLTLIPIYFAFVDTVPLGKAISVSVYNTAVYKPLNIVLIVLTEFLATITDVLLLRKVILSRRDLVTSEISHSTRAMSHKKEKQRPVSNDLIKSYVLVWFLLICDILLKVLISLGYPVLFDSAISLLTLAMRARVNLQYGLDMQNIIGSAFNQSKSNKIEESAMSMVNRNK